MIQELVIRISQTESKGLYIKKSQTNPNNDLILFVLKYIREHIAENLSVALLSAKAYMSESKFLRKK